MGARDGQSGACAAEPEIAGRALKRGLKSGVRSAVSMKPPTQGCASAKINPA